ncbi:MAG TPA: hypothetical protein VIY49_20265 [Bryobacteraceae bacterium]
MSDTTRRTFLAAGAASAVPFFIKGDDKAGTKNKTLGEGEHQYECIHDWGQLPSNIKYGNTHSVCEDSQRHIYIHHTVYKDSPSADSVVVFDEKGKFVRSFGPMFRGGAHGMHLSKEGNTEYLYFCDEKHGIITKRTLKGEEIWTMGYPQDSPPYTKAPGMPGLNYRPTNFAIAPNLDFWVGDGYGSYYMFHYSQASSTAYPKLVRTFGGPPAGQAQGGGRGAGAGGGGGKGKGGGGGKGDGAAAAPGAQAAAGGPPGGGAGKGAGGGGGRGPAQPPPPGQPGVPRDVPIESMNNPHGNMVDLRDPANPILLVADRGNNRIVRYTLDDKPMDVVAGTKSPCHFHTFKETIVVPDLQARVTLLDKSNKIILHLGEPLVPNPARTTDNRADFVPGQFVQPHGAIFDHSGNIFVAEWVEIGRVTKLRKV